MSHEVEFVPGNEAEGFDRDEPATGLVGIFAAVSIVALLLVFWGSEAYYEHVKEQDLYEKVLAPVSQDLQALHAREEIQLHSYGYINKDKQQVRLPIDKAMDLVAKEYAEGKVWYSTKPAPVKPPEPVGAAAPVTPNAAPKK